MPVRKLQRFTEQDLQRVVARRNGGAAAADVAAGAAPGIPAGQTGAGAGGSTQGGNDPAARKPSKYSNHKTEVNGEKFDSKAELRRFNQLKLMELAGDIKGLQRQVEYLLIPAQIKPRCGTERAVKYRADFVYYDSTGLVVEDVKGMRTPDYVIKRKLMLHVHDIEIVEIKA